MPPFVFWAEGLVCLVTIFTPSTTTRLCLQGILPIPCVVCNELAIVIFPRFIITGNHNYRIAFFNIELWFKSCSHCSKLLPLAEFLTNFNLLVSDLSFTAFNRAHKLRYL